MSSLYQVILFWTAPIDIKEATKELTIKCTCKAKNNSLPVHHESMADGPWLLCCTRIGDSRLAMPYFTISTNLELGFFA